MVILLTTAIFVPIVYWHYAFAEKAEPVFFGVSFGGKTASEAKLLIDKVKDYTNFFLVNSWDLTTNETALNEVCDYAAKADLNFLVFFSFVSRIAYPWHQTWLDTVKEKWGDHFLGVYLFDEPGGKQVDTGGWNEEMGKIFENASSYSEAANTFVESISSINSTLDLKRRGIPMFTSDYALYWFDYLAGYDTVFVELAWNHSRAQNIALCRGAATAQGKDWGAILTWTYDEPPYLASGPEILGDMLTAYEAGAKYVIVFNYPTYPEDNPYGILSEEHFSAMQQFWTYMRQYPEYHGKEKAQAVFVLPKDYGWGMRNPQDTIWGLWRTDTASQQIWTQLQNKLQQHGSKLDIVYDDSAFPLAGKYSQVYYWNQTS